MKKRFILSVLLLLSLMTAVFTAGCDSFAEEEAEGEDTLYIYSWGDYRDLALIDI